MTTTARALDLAGEGKSRAEIMSTLHKEIPMEQKDDGGTTKIMVVHETAMQSWARDAGTVCAAIALILPGWWLGATWLSATGFLLFWAWLFNASFRAHKKHTFSIPEAKMEIDRIAARSGGET